MKLWTLNKWLRRVGLVLVVSVDEDGVEDAELWLERAKTYDARVNPAPSTKQVEPWIDKVPNIRAWIDGHTTSSQSCPTCGQKPCVFAPKKETP